MRQSIKSYMESKPAQTMTLFTILYFLAGFIYLYSLWFSIILTLFLSIAIMVFLYLSSQTSIPIHVSLKQFFKILLTMYIFGIVDAYCLTPPISLFSIYLILSTIRYYGEFLLINYFHHHELKWGSFLIYHSAHYTMANIFLLIEHCITKYLFGFQYKEYHCLVVPAFIITTVTTFSRIFSFFTAKSNFTHQVAQRYKRGHILVTEGIYKYLRHPSYTSFYYNSVFGMVLIGNFISAFVFAFALSRFFEDRIYIQEYYLVNFFGDRYINYRSKTYVLIPYIPQSVKNFIESLLNRSNAAKDQ